MENELTAPSAQIPPDPLARDKLERLYGHALSLLTYEGTLFTSRSGHAVTTQAILFSAFFFVMNTGNMGPRSKWEAELLICGAGIAFLVSYALLIARNLSSANFWRSRLLQIERDPRFWYPADKSQFSGLDILGCRSRMSVREMLDPSISKTFKRTFRDAVLSFLNRLVQDPLDFYAIYFPVIFTIIWLILAVSSLT